jgi:hypothetical protein
MSHPSLSSCSPRAGHRWAVAFVALLMLTAASSARAALRELWQSPSGGDFAAASTEPADGASDVPAANPFARGQWSLEFTTSYTDPFHHGPQELFTGNVGVGYSPKDGLMSVVELTGAIATDDFGDDGVFTGLTLRTRLEVWKVKSASLFIEGSIGVIESDVGIPDGGTHFNFRETAGVGVALPVGQRFTLLGGARLLHISNAGLGHDNPGYSGTEFYVGVNIPL